MRRAKQILLLPAVLLMVLTASLLRPAAAEEMNQPVLLSGEEVVWTEGPASMPPGTEMAILEGDLKKPGPITVRFKVPADAVIAPHTHPGLERVTVLSGTLYFGTGEIADESKAKALTPGSFIAMPARHPMYAYTTSEETVIQLNVEGPWGITFLDNTAG
jgi:quercetin dioxygenase-like cupin family protein